jgi:ribosomal protein S18 acetylase RimI-like enzyme
METNTKEKNQRIIKILTESFDDNKSVNYIIPQDGKRQERIKALMAYSLEICNAFGKVYLSDDENACALVVYPEKKKTTLKSILFDVKFIYSSIGIANIKKAMQREAAIKKLHPPGLLSYLWFIGVTPAKQGKSYGSRLLSEVLNDANADNRTVCLETSTAKNIPWYKNFGFEIYCQLDFGYPLYCLKKTP